jgi:ribosomal protein S12
VIGHKSGGRTKERAMPTLNQLIRHGREEKMAHDRTRASDQSPQKQGVCSRFSTIEISQMTPLSHNAVKADNSPLRRM